MQIEEPVRVGALRGETEAILEELARAYEEIHVLHGFAGALEGEVDHRAVFRKVIACLREMVPIDAADVWVPDSERGVYRRLMRCERNEVGPCPESVPFDPCFSQLLAGMGARVLRGGQRPSSPLDIFLVRLTRGIGLPAVAVPLVTRSSVTGLLLAKIPAAVDRIDAPRLRLFAAAARQTSLSLHFHTLVEELRSSEGLRTEVEIARRIQRDLLPQKVPRSEAYDLFAGCITAARVGGDYYDFVHRSDGSLGLLIADVSGHSVASGLLAMSFRSAFRLFHAQEDDLGKLFSRINDSLVGEMEKTSNFLSACYVTFDPRTRRLTYVNAGHNPPIVWRGGSGEFQLLEGTGLLIGILPGESYGAAQVDLGPGDVLLLYTDGIVEAENQKGEFFGLERLKEAVKSHSRRSSREMYHYVLKEMYLFQDEHFNKDDVTLIALKVRPGSPS
ncbi:MAG: PP2C family protein-serine/threonine phosphatase [Planctomycetes bacterium]|nr:PP2C family protein-serine/threonine phosphatase [Planctomycetota bacterium]